MMASTKGHTTTVQILVRAGADTKAKGKVSDGIEGKRRESGSRAHTVSFG
jgi:hypothetical protein